MPVATSAPTVETVRYYVRTLDAKTGRVTSNYHTGSGDYEAAKKTAESLQRGNSSLCVQIMEYRITQTATLMEELSPVS